MRIFLTLLLLVALCTCAPPPDETAENAPEIVEAIRHEWPREAPIRIILDSDTANEIDDLFAIAYLLKEGYPGVEVLGLSSAQWFHVWSGDRTVYQSQQLNEELLGIMGRTDLPHPLGADVIMGKPWGDYDPRDSPAAQFIIEEAMALNEGEKLAVLSIGFDGHFWNKDEFNIRRDLNAANYLLNAEGLELHVMPISVAIKYTWERENTFRQLGKAGKLGAYLRTRWEDHGGPNAEKWTMWDVALLQAFLKPEQASEVSVLTPPENTQRSVWMYEDIKAEEMEADFWDRLITSKNAD